MQLSLPSYSASVATLPAAEKLLKQAQETKRALREHITFLADDALKGRNTASEEYEIAGRYVADQFKQIGLKPGGENHTWVQSVPFAQSLIEQHSMQLQISGAAQPLQLIPQEDYFLFPGALSSHDEITAPLVFVGYGISSPKLQYDDYQGIDVKGKIAVFLSGRPRSMPSEEGAHVGDIREKIRQAAEHGAAGVIGIDTSKEGRSYLNLRSKASMPLLKWKTKEGKIFDEYPTLKGVAYVRYDAGEKIFLAAHKNLKEIRLALEKDKPLVKFAMGIHGSLKRTSHHKTVFSSNIIGILEGSDPELRHEYLVYTAHLDHLGKNTHNGDRKTDLINNGALDNASGVAVMLETARLLSQGERPKRSILFLAVTAEEQGLLGSEYFAHNPTVPASSIVANVNLDLVLMLYPFADIIAFGAEHSTLGAKVKSAAAKNRIQLSPDPIPEKAIFVRSDHYSFVKQGIPSVYLMVGFTSNDPQINGPEAYGRFYGEHYHQPSDDASLAINYDAGVVFTKISRDVAKEIANSEVRPSWHKNDFFGDTFSK